MGKVHRCSLLKTPWALYSNCGRAAVIWGTRAKLGLNSRSTVFIIIVYISIMQAQP